MTRSDPLLTAILRVLCVRLPPGWQVSSSTSEELQILELTDPGGTTGVLPFRGFRHLSPRDARSISTDGPVLVATAYLSQGVQDVLEERGHCYADKTGNVRLVLPKPGLYVLTPGADKNPWPDERRPTLRGVKAGRVVGALCTAPLPFGVRDLAAVAGTDPGYVSRLLAMLDREALVDRTRRGQVERVHWRRLLERWAQDAPVESRAQTSTWLAARGLPAFFEALRETGAPYILTGSVAAYRLAPVAPPRLASVYVDDPEALAGELGLRETSTGANVVLLRPEDPALHEQGRVEEGLRYAPLAVVVADLLTGPGRSPAEAEALLDWMADHEEVWRG